MDERIQAIGEFFDREACCKVERGSFAVVEPIVTAFAELLESAGVRGRTVLELGSGTGTLAVEMLRRGAEHVTGIELSGESVAAARRAVAKAGVEDRATFHVGDAAIVPLDKHDAVVSCRVFCCYPDPVPLLENSLQAAGSVYGLVLPVSSGLGGLIARVSFVLETLWHAVRRRGMQAYVHDAAAIDRRIREAGFRPLARARRRLWLLAVYVRPSPG